MCFLLAFPRRRGYSISLAWGSTFVHDDVDELEEPLESMIAVLCTWPHDFDGDVKVNRHGYKMSWEQHK